jgi:hypothetical protein
VPGGGSVVVTQQLLPHLFHSLQCQTMLNAVAAVVCKAVEEAIEAHIELHR